MIKVCSEQITKCNVVKGELPSLSVRLTLSLPYMDATASAGIDYQECHSTQMAEIF